ncbi:hypothetical protein UFOVP928_3 [uncultured Caudovirales phage]|uniref:Uncharacterized protein n=1 Tax=uncultured Caudovirales phage TaxID=2100421 RepID=A0A6J5PNM6_9CAUD|nr:hypothetical protein UFOVP578_29 [uncultured Caudovirales phage]CAB4171566.1 hypothetical protein UFOVP928_3 [uncultured Caudovirales phage]CAB4183842.1 hypothetical protein UFOVP1098_13 [uncultured Caudovirales phage]CAB4200077.1 hypothetical protein UFOVP1353_20 [uncultured Caudovirales phage]CAB4214368.1 hypothetical protein UFOVP1458_32 [uncultured Caudovirales phage]
MSMIDAVSGNYGLSEAGAILRRRNRSIANQQAATLGQQRGSRKMSDITKQYVEGFQPKMAQYGRRGLAGPNVKSGIQRKGLEQYATNLQSSLGAESTNLQNELNQISVDEANSESELQQYINDLALAKNQRIIDTATALRQLQGY